MQMLLKQIALAQSLAEIQPWPLAQPAQMPPPQSTSLSLPFLTPSEHVGA